AYGSHKAGTRVKQVSDLPEHVLALLEADVHNQALVQNNSSVLYYSLPDSLANQGVIFMDLSTALIEHGELVKEHFMKAVEPGENKLTALHAAAWSGGVFLYVPKNVHITVPIHALFLTDDAEATFA